MRCWGASPDGQLGYGNTRTIGDDETPGSVAPVNVGAGRTATALALGHFHSCALLDNGAVRCWGFGVNGRPGYGNTESVGDDESPGSVAPVDLGGGRTAKAITAGGAHSCALLDDDSVRCWGFNGNGQLGYGNTESVGDDESPGSVAPVDLGPGRTAVAISAGDRHTCAVLDDGSVRCWGHNNHGELGYGTVNPFGSPTATDIGDNETPGSVAPVSLGDARSARAISAGGTHTCALLDDATVRCWGAGGTGQLGYGDTSDRYAPTPTPIDLGPGRRAAAISVGTAHSCARLEDGSVRCWGQGADGQLGYGNIEKVGDNEAPGAVPALNLGTGRTALAVGPGQNHTCARLEDGRVRCWGNGANGRLGYCSERTIGDDEAPGSAGPVDLGGGGARCPSSQRPTSPTSPSAGDSASARSYAARVRGLRRCLAAVTRHARRERRLSRQGSARQRARLRRHRKRHARSARRRCLRLFGRTPGRISALRARPLGRTRIELRFEAAGTDGDQPPPARSYVVKQSRRPIRSARGFTRAQTLCKGRCRFTPSAVGAKIALTVTGLRRRTTYYYALAARDNLSGRRGPRSTTVKVRTRG